MKKIIRFLTLFLLIINNLSVLYFNDNEENNTYKIIKQQNDVEIIGYNDFNIYDDLAINDSFSGMLNYNISKRYLRYNAIKTSLISLDVETNYVYGKIIDVKVYRKNYQNDDCKYLFSYDSLLDKKPELFIYKNEIYIFEISSHDISGTTGVEFTYSGYLKGIDNYDYLSYDFETKYTYGISYDDGNNITLSTTEKVLSYKESYYTKDTTIYPYNAIGYLKTSIYNPNYTSNYRSTVSLINNEYILGCAHSFVELTDYYVDNIMIKHFNFDEAIIYFGLNNNEMTYQEINVKKVFVPKQYFLYSSLGINGNGHKDFDISISYIEDTTSLGIKPLDFRYDNNFYLYNFSNVSIIGYPYTKNRYQYIIPLYDFRRSSNYRYYYYGDDLVGGTSGSPIIYYNGSNYTIIGVNTHKGDNYAFGTILSNKFYKFINYIMG